MGLYPQSCGGTVRIRLARLSHLPCRGLTGHLLHAGQLRQVETCAGTEEGASIRFVEGSLNTRKTSVQRDGSQWLVDVITASDKRALLGSGALASFVDGISQREG